MFKYPYQRISLSVKSIALVLLALAMLLCWQSRAGADTGVITGSVVNIRSGPATSYAISGNLLQGTRVSVLEAKNGWYRVSYDNHTGWISGQYIEVKKDPTVKVSGQVVNLRSGPGTEHKVVGQALQGDVLILLNQGSEWSQVQTGSGLKCYIAANLIQVGTGSTPAPAPSGPPAPPPSGPPAPPVEDEIKVLLDGFLLQFDVPPQIHNNRTLVPLRQIFESMGATVEWNQSTQTVTATRDGVVIVLPIGSTNPTVNGTPWPLDVPARIVEGRTLAPLRFVGEAYGGQVSWDQATLTVQMFSPQPPAVPVVAEPAGKHIMVRDPLVNLRSGPGTGFAKISAASAGEMLPVVGEQDGWFQVSRGGSLAWIAGWLVEMPGRPDDSEDVPLPPAVGDDKLVWYYTSKDKDGLRINIESGARLGCHLDENNNNLVYTVMGRSLKGSSPLTVSLGGQKVVVSGENRDGNATITVALPPDVKYRKVVSSDGKCESVLIENRIVEVSRKVFGNIGDNIIIYTLTPCEYTYSFKNDILEITLQATYQGVERSSYDYQVSPLLERMTIKETSGSPPDTILRIETKNLGDYRIFQTSDDNALNIVLTTTKRSEDKNNKLVILDPGHGGGDPGASGAVLQEKTVNLDIALRVGDILAARKFDVAYTRDNDRNPTQTERAEIANQLNAAVFVSIHNNANESPDKEGTETHYYASLDDPALFMQKDQRSKLAAFLQQRMMQNLQRVNRGVKQSGFTVLTKTTMPSALVEIVFISNPAEEALLMNNEFKSQAAAAIADGITDYLNSR